MYLLAPHRNGTLSLGVTSNLIEKQIKKWHRTWKLDLIEQANPDWQDLAVTLGLNSRA
ncbi:MULTISPECIES: hypothetical protein [unclassified Sphingobium]|uniref:hypothetical protein n=1 Tax=unclassified Sphingobium TaxID=2611147 RepID=UPI0022257F63|nr:MULTISPECIES: hypothetical protein [unclassified Sphingobium]MCW2381068.1 putative GIY-YIG superfamily endonuclease [Sphingobium sp. B2D3B]MCW2398825.1 putative GIY-YIG superfamily endonuclease [Sphingobium sp. B2D3C]